MAVAVPLVSRDDAPTAVTAVPLAGDSPLRFENLALGRPKVYGGYGTRATVTFSKKAPRSGLTVRISASGLKAPAQLKIKGGHRSGSFWIATKATALKRSATVKVTYGRTVRKRVLSVLPLPALQTLAVSTPSITLGGSAVGTVRLNGPAQPEGSVIALSSSSKAVRIPAKVRVGEDRRSASFPIVSVASAAPQSVTLSAKRGSSKRAVTLRLTKTAPHPPAPHDPGPSPSPSPSTPGSPPSASSTRVTGLVVTPDMLKPGATGTATLTLERPAPAGGQPVTLTVLNGSGYATVPGSVTVPQGQSTLEVPVTATEPKDDPHESEVVVEAAAGGATAKTSFTVVPRLRLRSLETDDHAFSRGLGHGRVVLNGPAPEDTFVTLSVVDNGPAYGLEGVVVTKGERKADFDFPAGFFGSHLTAPTPLTLKATLGEDSVTGKLTVEPGLKSVVSDPLLRSIVHYSQKVVITVTLHGVGGHDVPITTDAEEMGIFTLQGDPPVIKAGEVSTQFTVLAPEGPEAGWPHQAHISLRVAGTMHDLVWRNYCLGPPWYC